MKSTDGKSLITIIKTLDKVLLLINCVWYSDLEFSVFQIMFSEIKNVSSEVKILWFQMVLKALNILYERELREDDFCFWMGLVFMRELMNESCK